MKTLLTIFTLVFTVMLSSTSFAEWEKVSKGVESGDTYYVDFERIRKHGGFVYFWVLGDALKPIQNTLSLKTYKEGDCKLFRFKRLSWSFHKEPMDGGTGDTNNDPDCPWSYKLEQSTA